MVLIKESSFTKIHVETLTGKSLPVFVSNISTVFDIKMEIQELEGIAVEKQILLHRKKELSNYVSISEAGLKHGSTVQLVLVMSGGYLFTRKVNHRASSLKSKYVHWTKVKVDFLSSLLDVCKSVPNDTKILITLYNWKQNLRLVARVHTSLLKQSHSTDLFLDSYKKRLSDRKKYCEKFSDFLKSSSSSSSPDTQNCIQKLYYFLLLIEMRMNIIELMDREPGNRSLFSDKARHLFPVDQQSIRNFQTEKLPDEKFDLLLFSLPMEKISSQILSSNYNFPKSICHFLLHNDLNCSHERIHGKHKSGDALTCVEIGQNLPRHDSFIDWFFNLTVYNKIGRKLYYFNKSTTEKSSSNNGFIFLQTFNKPKLQMIREGNDDDGSGQEEQKSAKRPNFNTKISNQNRNEEITYEMCSERIEEKIPKNEFFVREIPPLIYANPTVTNANATATATITGPIASATKNLLPVRMEESVANTKTKTSSATRCSQCKKRINITNMHTCRCGSKFCAAHRYAEEHGCNYDYKTEGRQKISRDNPVVRAQKINKI